MGVCALLFVMDPALKNTISIAYYGGPIFLFELSIGLWLAIRGISRSGGLMIGRSEDRTA